MGYYYNITIIGLEALFWVRYVSEPILQSGTILQYQMCLLVFHIHDSCNFIYIYNILFPLIVNLF